MQRIIAFWNNQKTVLILAMWVIFWARLRQSLMAEFREPFTDLFGDTEILVKACSFAVYAVLVAWPLVLVPLFRRVTVDVVEKEAATFPISFSLSPRSPVFTVGSWFVGVCFGVVASYIAFRVFMPFVEEEIFSNEEPLHYWVSAFDSFCG
jgi:hypothetical protein